MVFSNLIFLYLFLPVCLIAYFFCPGIRAKNAVLILFSLIFYAWGEPVYLLLMIASAAVNWYFGLLIERRRKKIFLILALVLDLGCLAVFKYAGFFVENLNAVFGASIPVPQIALPIGISFYTFQALSYTVDVWRGDVPAQRSFAKLLLYISLFPQLIAGPIVRYSDVAAQIDDRQFDASEAFYGATRFCIGLAKKVLLADAAGKVASQILDGTMSRFASPTAYTLNCGTAGTGLYMRSRCETTAFRSALHRVRCAQCAFAANSVRSLPFPFRRRPSRSSFAPLPVSVSMSRTCCRWIGRHSGWTKNCSVRRMKF